MTFQVVWGSFYSSRKGGPSPFHLSYIALKMANTQRHRTLHTSCAASHSKFKKKTIQRVREKSVNCRMASVVQRQRRLVSPTADGGAVLTRKKTTSPTLPLSLSLSFTFLLISHPRTKKQKQFPTPLPHYKATELRRGRGGGGGNHRHVSFSRALNPSDTQRVLNI